MINSTQYREGEVVLSGGSYSDVTLMNHEGGAFIRKMISKIGAADATDRVAPPRE